MMEVALHIPDDVAQQMRRVNGQDIARHILEEYKIRAYQEHTLGESHLRRLLGFATRDELEEFFAAYQVYRNYVLEDLEQDQRTALQLGL